MESNLSGKKWKAFLSHGHLFSLHFEGKANTGQGGAGKECFDFPSADGNWQWS